MNTNNSAMSFYEGDGNSSRLAKARLLLCIFSPDQLADIAELVSLRGMNIIDDVHGGKISTDPPAFMSILSRKYIQDNETNDLIVGLSAVVMAGLKNPDFGAGEYKDILKSAFSMPDSMATALANKIETVDPLVVKSADGETDYWATTKAFLSTAVAKVVNVVPDLLDINWRMGRDQDGDVDFLYELSKLGKVSIDLQERMRLMKAGAMLDATSSVFANGQANSGDPVDRDTADVLEKISALSHKRLPLSMSGGFGDVADKIQSATATHLANRLRNEGVMDEKGRLINIDAVPGEGFPIAGAVGILKALMNHNQTSEEGEGLFRKLAGLFGKGDPSSTDNFKAVSNIQAIAQDIADQHGNDTAANWLRGDIDSLVGDALEDAMECTDDDLEALASENGDVDEIAYLVDQYTPEVGGWLTKFRAKRAAKRFDRRKSRKQRQAARHSARQQDRSDRQAYRKARKSLNRDMYTQDPESMDIDMGVTNNNFRSEGYYYPQEDSGYYYDQGYDQYSDSNYGYDPSGGVSDFTDYFPQ